jgi:hypothetical protein
MWQKSNETDFLLTMNFILFTNQGYRLQNSSLGQLHSDGGVVSIVRRSAGRLLLEYLSARRLRSSGYYPKYQNVCLKKAMSSVYTQCVKSVQGVLFILEPGTCYWHNSVAC